MNSILTPTQLTAYVGRQLQSLFDDGAALDRGELAKATRDALDRLEFCFKHSSLKHYCDGGTAQFNHLFTDQYASFLWFLGNTLWQQLGKSPNPLLDKLFALNKALHGIEVSYSTQLPRIFVFSHTVGVVLGKATYADFLVVSNGCTVGQHKDRYPVIGEGVALAAHSSVIGDSRIGRCVSIGSNATVFQKDIADFSSVYRDSNGNTVVRSSPTPYAQRFFGDNLAISLAANQGA